MAPLDNLRMLRNRPLAIICGKPEEADIIAQEMKATREISGAAVELINRNHNFHLGELVIPGGRKLEYYITSSLRQGLVHFATHVGILFQVLKPRFAIHAGVCAGNEAAGVKLGQVIFGEAAISYDEGKWVQRDGKSIFLPDYDPVRIPLSKLAAYAAQHPNYKHGDYVSGLSVQEDAKRVFERVTVSADRKAMALDMEASAFLSLCQHTEVMSLGVIKGVSDFGDPDKTKVAANYRETLNITAAAVKDWLETIMRTMSWSVSEENELGARLSKQYYQNFVRLLVDSMGQGMDVETLVGNEKLPAAEGVKIVMPHNLNPDFYAEQGQIQSLARSFGLSEVSIGRGSYRRTCYYGQSYLIDFPRTLNTLQVTDEPIYQTLVFDKFLKVQHYCKQSSNQYGRPPAEVLTWDEFVESFERSRGPRARDTQEVLARTDSPSGLDR